MRRKSRRQIQIEEDIKTSRKLTEFFKPGKMKIELIEAPKEAKPKKSDE